MPITSSSSLTLTCFVEWMVVPCCSKTANISMDPQCVWNHGTMDATTMVGHSLTLIKQNSRGAGRGRGVCSAWCASSRSEGVQLYPYSLKLYDEYGPRLKEELFHGTQLTSRFSLSVSIRPLRHGITNSHTFLLNGTSPLTSLPKRKAGLPIPT
eukprot:scaffold90095_cov30-Attheya_sp.AAC.2